MASVCAHALSAEVKSTSAGNSNTSIVVCQNTSPGVAADRKMMNPLEIERRESPKWRSPIAAAVRRNRTLRLMTHFPA